MSGHPVLDLGAAVRVLNDGQAWEIGVDHLDVDTYLAGGEAGGALLDLTPHLIEAQWVQGTGDAVNPDGVLPRGEAGTATLTLWDPTGEYMPPPADPFGGVRPGRRVVLYERDSARNPTTVLWAGWVEQLERDAPPDGPTVTVITAVDSITKLVNSVPTPPDARSPETPYERAVWASDVLTPGLPALLDPAATAANVAGTQVGDSAWKTLVDAADVELGALFTLRDGTLVTARQQCGGVHQPLAGHMAARGPRRAAPHRRLVGRRRISDRHPERAARPDRTRPGCAVRRGHGPAAGAAVGRGNLRSLPASAGRRTLRNAARKPGETRRRPRTR